MEILCIYTYSEVNMNVKIKPNKHGTEIFLYSCVHCFSYFSSHEVMHGHQGLSQDLETGCLKLAVVKFLASRFLLGGSQYTHISTINMYKFIKIRHDIIKQCHGNYK